MAKKTLLEMVQDILSDMDSDDVNSINDTVEAMQVASIVRTTYEEMIDGANWPHLKSVFRLEGLGDTDTPTHMKLPENVKELDGLTHVRYNKRRTADTKDKYETVIFKEIEDFLVLIMGRDSGASNMQTVTGIGGATLFIRNDLPPSFWTTFDDEHIVFDSFDNLVDTTLQASKSQVVGFREPSFTLLDGFIPDLPSESFSKLLAESKSVAFNALKQLVNQKEEQRSKRQSRWLAQKNWRAHKKNRYPNYGRRGRVNIGTHHRNPLFDKETT